MAFDEAVLTRKIYYEQLLKDGKTDDPYKTLGELFFTQQKETPEDLSTIRYAQGELYYHCQDYETAIFKWENIHNELEPWARKNMADAYVELELLESAENIYRSITSDSLILNTEITLQLFGLYIEQNRDLEAKEMIQNALLLNPDYPNVTTLARAFFEKIGDWESAIELAVSESMRTTDLKWFTILHSYIEKGKVTNYEPSYFIPALTVLMNTDLVYFEKLVCAFWEHYQKQESYLSWIREINSIILQLGKTHQWEKLIEQYKTAYLHVLSGEYLYSDIDEIIPELLQAWLVLSEVEQPIFSASALVAWNDVFPNKIDQSFLQKAEMILEDVKESEDYFMDVNQIYEAMKKWADDHGVAINQRFDWIIEQLGNRHIRHLLIGGTPQSGKDAFLSEIINKDVMTAKSIIGTVFASEQKTNDRFISKDGIIDVQELNNVSDMYPSYEDIIELAQPDIFLEEKKLAMIDLHHYQWRYEERKALPQTFRLADQLLFLLNGQNPFTDSERLLLMQINKQFPNMDIDFLINSDQVDNPDTIRLTTERVQIYFPKAKVFVYSSLDSTKKVLGECLQAYYGNKLKVNHRSEHLLHFIREMIHYLEHQHVNTKHELVDFIARDEDVLTRLKGSIHQLQDMEEDTARALQEEFSAIKQNLQADLKKAIPELMKTSARLVKDDSDFRNIHLKINKDMNDKIETYMSDTVLPAFTRFLENWVTVAEEKLIANQSQLTEWSQGFNELFHHEKVQLFCDFQILEDWKRDADRMTSTIQMDRENIFLKRTPSQVLLKGAGKLFGTFSKNNSVLANTYRNFIENEKYDELTEVIANKFFQQFELFEKGIARDIHIFYREPVRILKEVVEELEAIIAANKASLMNMKEKPELFFDPLKFYEVRIRQYEWMIKGDVWDRSSIPFPF